MPDRDRSTAADRVTDGELDAVLAACRLLVAVSASSIASAEDTVDLPQFRALVIVSSRGVVSLAELADAAGMNMSTASRTGDRLVAKNLLHRAEDPHNRRQLQLTLTHSGQNLVAQAMRRRRAALRPMLAKLPRQRRAELVRVLGELAEAGGELSDRDLWWMGWTSA
jgi:DNA-binding MarR family transcriptional regulator